MLHKENKKRNLWFLRPVVLVTLVLFLAGLTYALVMQWQIQKEEAETAQLQQDCAAKQEEAKQAEAQYIAKPKSRKQLNNLLENYLAREQRVKQGRDYIKAEVDKLKELDRVKAYLSKSAQLRELKEKNQTLYQQVEEKKKRYRDLNKKAQEG